MKNFEAKVLNTVTVIALLVALFFFARIALGAQVYEISRIDPRVDKINNTGDPWVVHVKDRYVMFRCQNSYEIPKLSQGVGTDRIWRTESIDGIKNWTNDHIVIEGAVGAQDDLSCSPGVVIAPDGTWHMYYETASRYSECAVEIWHATSPDGEVWTKLGKVAAVPTSDCSLQQPSPVIENGTIVVYFVVNWSGASRLWRMGSSLYDGQNFSPPVLAGDVWQSQNARYNDGHLVYSNAPAGEVQQTTEMYLSNSLVPGELLLETTPGTFYSTYVTAGNYVAGPPARVYFAGNWMQPCTPEMAWGTCNNFDTAIGVIVFNDAVTPPEPLPVGYNLYSLVGCSVMYWPDWTAMPAGWSLFPQPGCRYHRPVISLQPRTPVDRSSFQK